MDTVKIKIGFSQPINNKFPIFSWGIRLLEGTDYSHVYAAWYSRGAGVNVFYEASGSSVHFTCEEVANNKFQTIHLYEIEIPRDGY